MPLKFEPGYEKIAIFVDEGGAQAMPRSKQRQANG
jgi:hypothetical protein